jgi:hypothetical protein
VVWLIEANAAATGKPYFGDGTPSCLFDFGKLNAFLRERSYLGLQVIAHEEKFVGIALRRVECDFCRRQIQNVLVAEFAVSWIGKAARTAAFSEQQAIIAG